MRGKCLAGQVLWKYSSQAGSYFAEPISYSIAVNPTLKLCKPSTQPFNNHILWHEFYRNVKGEEPIFSVGSVIAKWKELTNKVFRSVSCYMPYIPLHIEHK